MPMIGWLCVHMAVRYFKAFEKFIPWIAFILLLFIGGKMLLEGFRNQNDDAGKTRLDWRALIIQGIATSIDALSVGFTIAEYNFIMALVCALIIAAVTYFICMAGLTFGKKFGTKLANKAAILGGVILSVIGLEILITGIF